MLHRQPMFFAFMRSSGRFVRQAAVCATAATVLTACGGGGSGGSAGGGPQMMVVPARVLVEGGDNETFENAPVVSSSTPITGMIDTPGDTDKAVLEVQPGTLRIETRGVRTIITMYEKSGEVIPGRSGSWIGVISQAVAMRNGGEINMEVTSTTVGEYTLTPRITPMTSMTPTTP